MRQGHDTQSFSSVTVLSNVAREQDGARAGGVAAVEVAGPPLLEATKNGGRLADESGPGRPG